jgi:hypothetical protein
MTLARFAALGLLIAVSVAVAPARAWAQSTVDAEILFQEGRRLLKEGKIAEACDKLEASERIESTVGVLLNAADCREKNHQLASAWGLFLKAAAAAKRAGGDSKRETEARRRADALAPRLSFLTVSVPDSSKIEGLTITRRGLAIDPALWNQGVPVDVGEYEISASAPGHEPWTTKVKVVGEGQRSVVEVPRFKRLEDLAEPVRRTPSDPISTPPPAARVIGPDVSEPGPSAPSRFTGRRKIGLGLAAVGLAAIGGGVVFALKSKDLQRQADEICPDTSCGDARGLELNKDAQSTALRAHIFLIGGGTAVAAGVVLWIIGKPPEPSSDGELSAAPVVTPGHLGFSVTGRF